MNMTCLSPTVAWIDPDKVTKNGKPEIIWKYDRSWRLTLDGLVNGRYKKIQEVSIPCGKCLMCRKRRGFEIGVRARCEAALYVVSSFITLTVSDDNLHVVFPAARLRHLPWQLFAKRLRKRIGKFRFLMCGEYGDTTRRPHYHAIIFGHQFLDCYYDADGCWHGSKLLEQCWPYGHVRVDRCNDNRIMYVAGYLLKQMPDDELLRSYCKWSRRPGLGAGYFDRFWQSFYKRDGFDFDVGADRVLSSIVWRNKLVPFASRYFDERLQLHDERIYDMLKVFRRLKVGASGGEQVLSHEAVSTIVKGLENKVAMYERRLASRTRDVHNADYASIPKISDDDRRELSPENGRELKRKKPCSG